MDQEKDWYLLQRGQKITIQGRLINNHDLEKFLKEWRHPQKKPSVSWSKYDNEDKDLTTYIDVSNIDKKVGSVFVAMEFNNTQKNIV